MGKRWYVIAAAAAGGLVISGVLATPAAAWDGGANLKVGDVVCTDQSRSDIGARFYGHVTDGSATATIRVASSVGGAETVVWSLTGSNLNIGKTVPASAAGTYFRGCVTITAATSNTWTNMAILPSGARGLGPRPAHCGVVARRARLWRQRHGARSAHRQRECSGDVVHQRHRRGLRIRRNSLLGQWTVGRSNLRAES